MTDRCQRPAIAYFVDTGTPAADTGYFLTPPPLTGTRVTVASMTDGAVTEWFLDDPGASQLVDVLRRRRDLVLTVHAFESRGAV